MATTNNRLQRNFYKWHRILGLTALVPIILWTLSGLSHPFMSNWFRPFIPEETYHGPALDKLKPALSLSQVLDQQHISQFRNFGLISYQGKRYYQLLLKDSTYQYYSADDAQLLPGGDRLYAIQMARYFTQDSTSKIRSAVLQTAFDGQYQPINHLLPVWKISFDRSDGMDIYVETGQSRMGTFNNNTRKAFLWLFGQFHTWDWLAALLGDQFRLVFLCCLVAVMFLSLITGITVYGFFWKRFKEVAQKRRANNRHDQRWIHRYHRQLGLTVSFLMLMFFTSAGFHLLVKLHNIGPQQKEYAQVITRDQLKADNLHLPIADSLVIRQGIVSIFGKAYYQVTGKDKQVHYFDADNGTELKNGDRQYAAFLAGYYRSGADQPTDISPIRQFTTEYGFINKRLPVEKVTFAGNDNWYIETSTAKLATHVAGIDRAEGFSFIFLHKFFWMTWAGKDIRDVVSMLAALCVLVTALLGFIAFIKNK